MMNVYYAKRVVFFKLFFIVLVSCFCCNACIEADEMKARLYIEDYKMIAIEEMHRMGVPASIKLAQAMLESDYGKSRLANEGKNHFGIKCKKGWQGQTIYHTDDAPDECFRKYGTIYESYLDHSEFLRFHRFNYYDDLFLLDKTDYRGWAYGLKKAGYATNPRYAELLISIIERYRLYEYDNAIVSRLNSNGPLVILYGAASNTIAFSGYQKTVSTQKTAFYKAPSSSTTAVFQSSPKVTFKDNRRPKKEVEEMASMDASIADSASNSEMESNDDENEAIAIQEQQTEIEEMPMMDSETPVEEERIIPLYQQMLINGKRAVSSNVTLVPAFVSHTYNIALSKIYDFNDLVVGQKFKPDTPIFFQKKKNKAEVKEEHIVMEGETMHDIAQEYGIKLLKLYRRNKMPLNSVPVEGEIVQLQKKVKESPKYRF